LDSILFEKCTAVICYLVSIGICFDDCSGFSQWVEGNAGLRLFC
jgi:hypothetical protein